MRKRHTLIIVKSAQPACFNHYTKLMTFKAVQRNQKIWQITYYAYVRLHYDYDDYVA